ncbi:DHA2 family efflux MFS transporter permease subunit [Amnibacterium kyonggiense]|uniref:DHA2 family lincomycin resistance protein-like MFS transporter n=1 Tax=Amnibacterium kyonggiense TaxID=595671 RepID=A0A4R7FRK0_9MICO|nr:DHA2 family efflux MFS transporter permease subunit [Amnibacterium kyonggiense]TDS80452.1 DHA2 family lincomycin resistance protein-like MFS transporter [Amnibacterium kyonggiense]
MTETIDRTSSAAAGGPERLSRSDATAIGVLLVSAFVIVLNETIMSVAIPVLIKDLHVDKSTGQWLSTAFILTMAVVIPVSGFLIQRTTTRMLFGIALGSFVAGTLLAALSPSFSVLLVARVIQGVGAAIITPLLMTTVMTIVPESRRGAMMGNISIVISVAPAIGPTVSGLILSVLAWPFIFWCILPIAVAGLVIGLRLIPNLGEPRHVPIDWISIPLSAIGFGGLVYGLNEVGVGASSKAGISLVAVSAPVLIGAVSLTLFLFRQRVLQRGDNALLDLRVFRSRVFTASVVSGSLAFLGLLGSAILLPIYLQQVLGLTPLQTGLLVLPGGLLMGLLGPVVGRLYDRFGPRPLLIPGLAIAMVALILLGTTLTETSAAWQVLLCHMLLSLGLATVLPSVFTAGLSAVPSRFTSYGSAIFATVQQVGGAAGTALAVTLLAIGASGFSGAGGAGAAEAAGTRLAFLVSAGVFVVAIAVGTLVKSVPSEGPRPVAH